jgi:hypothetical protein
LKARNRSLIQPINRVFGAALLAITALGYADRGALAQATCRADVSYSVKKASSEESVVVKQEEARGPEEAAVKEALLQRLVISRQEALAICRERHENVSACVASKFAKNGGLMQQLPFAARVKLQEAIDSDCKSQQGVCSEGKAIEPVCTFIKPVETAVADAPAEKDAGKSGKKGGKK